MRGPLVMAVLSLVLTMLTGASGSRCARNEGDLGVVLHDVGSTLYETPVRVYYSAFCGASKDNPLNFPQAQSYDFKTPRTERTGVDALRAMLAAHVPQASVTETPRHVLQVRVGAVTTPILGARISDLKLTPLEQYNPNLAIEAIEKTTEITSTMQRYGLRYPLMLVDMLIVKPRQGLPHLPAIIRDVTVDEALDSVALAFDGVVVYDECFQRQGGGYLSLSFIGLGTAP